MKKNFLLIVSMFFGLTVQASHSLLKNKDNDQIKDIIKTVATKHSQYCGFFGGCLGSIYAYKIGTLASTNGVCTVLGAGACCGLVVFSVVHASGHDIIKIIEEVNNPKIVIPLTMKNR
jgi:hypothetical protein